MADVKISGLPASTTPLAGTEVLPIVQGGQTRQVSVANLTAGRAIDATNATFTGALNVTPTWNNVSTTFTGIKLNVTDTASAAASLLMDLQIGGVSQISVSKAGALAGKINANLFSNNAVNINDSLFGNALIGIGGQFLLNAANANVGFVLSAVMPLSWSPNSSVTSYANINAPDLFIRRDAANTLAQRNGVNAQTSRIYNTYTDASNYERGFMRWNSNAMEFGAEVAGTGTAREVNLTAGGGFIRISGSATGGMAIGGAPEGNARLSIYTNVRFASQTISLDSTTAFGWGATSWSPDITLVRVAAGIVGVRDGATGGGVLSFIEQTAPAAPAANGVYLYAEDNGSGKTKLMARFATGAAVQIAIEP